MVPMRPSIGGNKQELNCLIRIHIPYYIEDKPIRQEKIQAIYIDAYWDYSQNYQEQQLQLWKCFELDAPAVEVEICWEKCKQTELIYPIMDTHSFRQKEQAEMS